MYVRYNNGDNSDITYIHTYMYTYMVAMLMHSPTSYVMKSCAFYIACVCVSV